MRDIAAVVAELRWMAEKIEGTAASAPNRSIVPGAEYAAACLRVRARFLEGGDDE